MVIDSITLFENMFDHLQEHRKTFYSLRNALRKMSVTTLLVQEQSLNDTNRVPFEHFVVDGVIRLSLKADMEKYRKRTLEVLKMRGTKILEGEHNYRIAERGIHLIPALTFIEDKFVMDEKDYTPTGIRKLDELLSGGIINGSAFLLDTNSKANFKNIVVSIFAEQFRAGHKIISMNSSITTMYDFEKNLGLFGINAAEQIANGNVYFIEHYNRPCPPEYEHAVIDASNLENENYRSRLSKKLNAVMEESLRRGEKWFFYYDLNTVFSQRGADFVVRFFAEEVALSRAYGVTIVALCNFAELDPKVASYLERTSNGVIRTWVDGNYQYLQVTKSPNGRVSEPMIIESADQIPYVALV